MDFICKAAEKLWVELVGTNAEYDKHKANGKVTGMKITNIFLGFSGVETMAVGQRSIEGFFSGNDRPQKRKAADASEVVRAEGSKRRQSPVGSSVADGPVRLGMTSETCLSFWCTRCVKEVRRPISDVDDQEVALSALKMEHEDFHFAQDLARENDGTANPVSNEKGKRRKKKELTEAKGIAKFFLPVSSKR